MRIILDNFFNLTMIIINLTITIISLTIFSHINLKHFISLFIEHFINLLKFLINYASRKFIKF